MIRLLTAPWRAVTDYFARFNGEDVRRAALISLIITIGALVYPAAAIAQQVRSAATGVAADACFISCTAIRSAGLIADLETALGMPVITSNQVLIWHALRTLGVTQAIRGFGTLFGR